jgi:hypothetical protein
MQAQERDIFKKAGFLMSIGSNQATSQSFRLIRASLRSTKESTMLVSHITLLPLRSTGRYGLSGIMTAVNM